MIYGKSGNQLTSIYDHMGGIAPSAYNKNGEQVFPDSTGISWSDVKWVCVGDSLTDPTINATYKYHAVIAHDVSLGRLTVLGKGGIGYWRGSDSNQCFYQRMEGNIPADTNLITIFGSVNDWNWKNGGITIGTVDDTLESGTYAGYVDQAIKVAKEQAPSAHIIIIGTPYFAQNVNSPNWRKATAMNKAKAEKYGIPFYDMFASQAVCKPSNPYYGKYVFLFNYSFNTRSKVEGLNYAKTVGDAFAGVYNMTEAPGHPNNAYHHDYIAPLFANYIAEVMGIDKSTIPEDLRIGENETTDFLDNFPKCVSLQIKAQGTFTAGASITPQDFEIKTVWDDGSIYDYWSAHNAAIGASVIDENNVYISLSNTATGEDAVTLGQGENTVFILYGSNSRYYSVKANIKITV